MVDFKEKLVILDDFYDLSEVDQRLLKCSDILAVTPLAFLACNKFKKEFFVFDNFFGVDQFRKENQLLINDVEKLFKTIDKEYESILKYSKAFTGNIYWFIIFFANLLYIFKIAENIRKQYKDCIYLGLKHPDILSGLNGSNILSDLTFSNHTLGIQNVISSLQSCLNIDKWIEYKPFAGHIDKRCLSVYAKNFLISIRNQAIYYRRRRELRVTQKRNALFILQRGYEVALLSPWLKNDFNLLSPLTSIIPSIHIDNDLKGELIYENKLKEFLSKRDYLHAFSKPIMKLFRLYHNSVLTSVPSFIKLFGNAIKRYDPKALLYSSGSVNIFEDLATLIADKHNIPVFYFQHAGATGFPSDPYEKYIDYNPEVQKINIIYSTKDYSENHHLIEDGAPLGSINLFHFFHKRVSKKKEILYCPGNFPVFAFKELMRNPSDFDIYNNHKEILEAILLSSVKADIKMHPVGEDFNNRYFQQLLRNYKNHKFNILRGFAVEKIIKKYRLLILDSIGSHLLALALTMDIPVILYYKEKSCIKKNYIHDLTKRVYLTDNKEYLGKLINLYKERKLDSKFNTDIVKKYAFPDINKNPVEAIYNYITEYIKDKSMKDQEQYVK